MKESIIGTREDLKFSKDILLDNLVVEQRFEQESTQPLDFDTSSRRALFAWYKTTDAFRIAYQELVRCCLMPRTNDELNRFRDCFAGRVYQDMAHAVLASRQSDLGGVLLSPKTTLELYQKLYPHAPLCKDPFRLGSLEGISVPDGVVIGEDRGRKDVVVVCEYTASGRKDPKEYYSHFQMQKKHFPEVFAQDSYLLFVVPKEGGLLRKIIEGVRFEAMPFNHSQLRDFIDGIYKSYSPDDYAGTVDDVRAWAREQYEKVLRLVDSGNPLTEEQKEFFHRVNRSLSKEANLALS